MISRRAENCPHCGHPDPVEESVRRFEERRDREREIAIARREHRRTYLRDELLLPGVIALALFGITVFIGWLMIMAHRHGW